MSESKIVSFSPKLTNLQTNRHILEATEYQMKTGKGGPAHCHGGDYTRAVAYKPRPRSRVRLAVRRVFVLSDGQPITIWQVLERAYPRLQRFTSWHYLAARRALRKSAVVIARNRFGRGRPNLWRRIRKSVGAGEKDESEQAH
jgi:hypothetical protein